MNLLDWEHFFRLVVCPRCRSALRQSNDSYACSSPNCALSRVQSFPVVQNKPVLVDFDQSILSRDEIFVMEEKQLASGKRDPFGVRAILKRLLPTNNVADKNAKRLLELVRNRSSEPVILIVGGGSKGKGADALYQTEAVKLISFDLYGSPLTQFIADAHKIPLADESVDAVWIQAVLEHVLDPWSVASEIYRVLKPTGLLYAETPFLQQVHAGPYDFTRFTESGHRWMFRKFDLIESGVVLGPATQLLSSLDHLVRGLSRSVKAGLVAKLILFWIQYLDRFIGHEFAIDAASAVFFLGRKSNQELRARDMVDYYNGRRRTRHPGGTATT